MFFNNIRFYSQIQNITVKQLYENWLKKFIECKISEPKESIQNILAHNLKSQSPVLNSKHLATKLNIGNVNKINEMCELRLKRMPVQYIIGEWPFRNLNLKLKPPIFIPRSETEHLVTIILDYLNQQFENQQNIRILELCCGSGAISLALLKENSKVFSVAIDQNIEACKLTLENAKFNNIDSNRLEVFNFELNETNYKLENIDGTFDVVISNPPYVPTADLANLQPEISMYEDLKALDGGLDGLNIVKLILKTAAYKLNNKSSLFLEIDPTHPQLINSILQQAPQDNDQCLKLCRIISDFHRRDRFVQIIKN